MNIIRKLIKKSAPSTGSKTIAKKRLQMALAVERTRYPSRA